jgi:hypothetical protein
MPAGRNSGFPRDGHGGYIAARAGVAQSVRAAESLGVALGDAPLGLVLRGSVSEALDGVDVLVDYTRGPSGLWPRATFR